MNFLRQIFQALLYPLQAVLASPGKVSSSARRLTSISLPAWVAILTFILLIFAAVAGYFAKFPNKAVRQLTPMERLIEIVLIIVIPIILYYALKYWLEGDVSRYPDIDYAWKAGIAELRLHGLDLEYTPVFLVLGSAGELQERSLFNAARLQLRVREIPTGAAALHWFAEPNGVYIVCTDVGCLSKLANVAKRSAEQGQSMPGRAHEPSGPANIRGTMVLDSGPEPGKTSMTSSQVFPTQAAQSTPNIRGTMVISSDQEDPVVSQVERIPVLLPQEVQRDQELRLEYLCRLLAKARQPLAPLNGILTLLPFSIVQTGRREGSELQRIVKRDLATVVRSLKLRCPVVSLVVGMEEEGGFREMVRRVGRDAALAQRFGRGFTVGPDTSTPVYHNPIPEQLEALAAQACGLYEAKIYELFREKGSLSKPGNTKLYALLCKIRRTVRVPLGNILVNGYSHDPDSKSEANAGPLFFSGCYFAATGESEDRQAFVKCVFDKLPSEQEGLEWTEAALQQEQRYRSWSQTILWVDVALLASSIGMIVYKLLGR